MSYKPPFYTRQEQLDAQASRMDNPNVVGSGYIHFGAMERLPASEALAANWQFAPAGGAEQALGGVPAYGMPPAMPVAGADWGVAPPARGVPPSAADRSSNWRSRADQQAAAAAAAAAAAEADAGQADTGVGGFGDPSACANPLMQHHAMSAPLGHYGQPQQPPGSVPPLAQFGAMSLQGGQPMPGMPGAVPPGPSAAFPSALTVLSSQAAPSAGAASSCFGAAMTAPADAGLGACYGAAVASGVDARLGVGGGMAPVSGACGYHQPQYAAPSVPAPNGMGAQQQQQQQQPAQPQTMAASVRQSAAPQTVHARPATKPAVAHAQPTAAYGHAPAPQPPPQPQQQPAAAAASQQAKRLVTTDDYAAAAKAWKPPKPATISATPSTSKQPDQSKSGGIQKPREWSCKRCSFINPGPARFCEMCTYDRVAGDKDNSHDDGWQNTSGSHGRDAHSGHNQPQQQPSKSRASAKNEKRRAKKHEDKH